MPGKVKVRILSGRNLPIMDRASDTCDAFVEVKIGNTNYKTEVFRHSLNPHWNSEWYRFEVDDEELQDEPLQIRVMDYDTYSANDAIGKIYIDLNPLLCKKAGSVMSGWFPIYDTMHGIRGEIHIIVKVHLFSDSNKYRESSCGVQFFYSEKIPQGYKAEAILGFVEELVVNDDPEYQWIDKIRTPRASNEARQTLFSKLSGEVQRKIGLKALELGGNSVIGYHQRFDLEGESGIVVRGIGTALILTKIPDCGQQMSPPLKDYGKESPILEDGLAMSAGSFSPPVGNSMMSSGKNVRSPAKMHFSSSCRGLSDSDLSSTPKGGNPPESNFSKLAIQRPAVAQESLSMLEYPFITMKQFPAGLIQHVGGVVSARSVKLLCQINNPEEPETRDAWWTELRKEIRSHVRALGCNVVLGYMETTNISDDVCILSASGTAAVLNTTTDFDTSDPLTAPMLGMSFMPHPPMVTSSVERKESDKENIRDRDKALKIDINSASKTKQFHQQDWNDECFLPPACQVCHIPYSETSIPFPATLVRCNVCRKAKVPEVLFMTIEPPPNIPVLGKGSLIQARVCRTKKDLKGEQNAKEISDSLPFLEYELHRQLLNKLKVKGMNAIFGLRVQVSVGDKLIAGIATGTGAFLTALPASYAPKITCDKEANAKKMSRVQKQLEDAILKNRQNYGINLDTIQDKNVKDDDQYSHGVYPDMDLSTGNKEACVLEVDDAEDVDIIAQLIDPHVPEGFELCNTEFLPGNDKFACDLQMFTRIFRTKLSSTINSQHIAKVLEAVLQSLYVKLLMLIPCCLSGLRFNVELVEQDEIQVSIIGVAIGLGDINVPCTLKLLKQEAELELQFELEDEESDFDTPERDRRNYFSFFRRQKKYCPHASLSDNSGVDLSPLSYVPGRKIDRYLGNLDFFFIRESSSIRENGGLNGFSHSFMNEIQTIVRAHVAALGGNAMVAFHMTECILLYNPHKNQGQCLVNVAGDAVLVQSPAVCVTDEDKINCDNVIENITTDT